MAREAAPCPPAPRLERSTISVVLPTAHPLLSPPTRASSATRQSVRNTSLNNARPVISRRGRTSMPGWCMSMANHEMPLCLGRSTSVRARSMPRSATWPPEVQTFWPLTTHSSPSRTARHCSPARSEPAPGSLNSWHHASWPLTMGRRYRSFCSSEPWATMVGPASMTPSPPGGPNAPAAAMASATTPASPRDRARPKDSSGHVGTAQCESHSRSHHSATVRSGSQLDASQASMSDRRSSLIVPPGSRPTGRRYKGWHRRVGRRAGVRGRWVRPRAGRR